MPASQPLTSGATPALLGRFQTSTVLARVREILSVPRGQVSGRGLLLGAERGFKAMLVAGLAPDRALWVTDDLESAYRIRQDLKGLLPGHIIETFPGPDALEGHILPLSWQEIIHRVHTVMALIGNSPIVVIVPLSGLFSWTLSPSRFRMECQTLVPGVERSLADLIKTLIRLGYQRVSNTQTRGEFSVRGGILDLFCPHEASPVRLEFFGDEIDEIRIFDPVTQRSRDLKTRLELVPARELILDEHELETIDPNQLSDDMGALLQSTLRDGAPKGSELLLDWLPQQRGLIEDHLGEKGLLIWDATPRAVSRASGLLNSAYPEGHVDSVLRVVERCQLLAFAPSPRPVNPLPVIELGTELGVNLEGDLDRFFQFVKDHLAHGRRVIYTVGTKGNLKRAHELFEERGISVALGLVEDTDKPMVSIIHGDLDSGFVLADDGLVVLSENDVWGDRFVRGDEPTAGEGSVSFTEFTDLDPGSIIVHIDHGIGKFHGLTHLVIDGIRQEFLEIEYAKGDKLFVPVNQLDRVQKFVGVQEGHGPSLSRLGTARWSNTKSKVRKDVEEMARRLVALYARRELSRAVQCGPDTVWQGELAEAFPFDETPDQTKTWARVRKDLQKERPMDRLVCGDVGFGKTEIAVRAAFKLVQEGRQVAVLVPTTILAQQHYLTFGQRLSSFPVTIRVISRLRTKAQQEETLQRLAEGQVDIIIGTHRLLSKDVKFKDLGLIVVDEEQKFGVKHKERLKEIKTGVHVLSMSATPIPRTLNLTMGGLRDIAVINTPPKGRIPVKTYVMEYTNEVVAGAIRRELERGGQVYYIYNRIEAMEAVKARVERLVPEARIQTGHGRMTADALERMMEGFYKGDFDVLISTTIVESGLDIPNVNTLIVHEASTLGLSQLYQLRGRVGRSSRQAYSYFLFPGRSLLSDLAYSRLKALEENTELGAGFKVAMRDLELRGAGNLLGEQQHGFIHSIGFEMYTRLLREAVADIKGEEELKPQDSCKLELRVDSYIPESYIPDADTRVGLYRQLANIITDRELDQAREDIADRFGPPPKSFDGLFKVIHLKILASQKGVSELKQEGARVRVMFKLDRPPRAEWIHALLDNPMMRIAFEPTEPPSILVDLGLRKNLAVVEMLEKVLKSA